MTQHNQNLLDLKDTYNNIEVPEEIDLIIENAIKKGRRHNRKKILRPSIAAACIVVFILSVNISPAFANYLCSVPGLENLIKLISFDKGLRYAANNGFVQDINSSAEDKGIKLTLNNMVIDSRKMIINYTIETSKVFNNLNLWNMKLIDNNGKELNTSISRTGKVDSTFKATGKKDGILEISLHDDSRLPEELVFSCRCISDVGDSGEMVRIDGNWDIKFKVSKNLTEVKPLDYTIDKNITLDYMNFKIEYMKVYPTVTDVKVKMDPLNKEKFVWFKNLHLEDINGTKYNMRGASWLSQDELIFHFESFYFSDVKKVSLAGDGIYCIPREDKYLMFDLDNKRIVDDGGYDLEFIQQKQNVTVNGEDYDFELAFRITDPEIVRENAYCIDGGIILDSSFYDENNIEYKRSIETLYSDSNSIQRSFIIKNMKLLPHTLKVKITGAARGILKSFNTELSK